MPIPYSTERQLQRTPWATIAPIGANAAVAVVTLASPEAYPIGQGPQARFEVDVEEGETVQALDIVLRRIRPLTVLVIDPQGRPVEGASVRMRIIDPDGQPVVGQSIMIRASYSEELGGQLPIQLSAKTDAEGRVEVGSLVPGIGYSFRVTEEREGRLDDLLKRELTPQPDVETDLGDLQLGK